MAKGIPVRGTEATLYEPTEKYRSWRISYIDRATGKRKTTSGGKTQEEAEDKARHLSGEYVEGWRIGDTPPTLQESVDSWLAANRSRWSSRTYDHYAYFAQKFTDLYGSRPITQISPADIRMVDLSKHSRGQQEKARTLLRGFFGHSAGWLERDPARAEKKIDTLAKAIVLSGNAAGKRNPRVPKGDIPSSKLIAAFIITAYHTLQVGPLDKLIDASNKEQDGTAISPAPTTVVDPITGEKTLGTEIRNQPVGSGLTDPLEDRFRGGLPRTYLVPDKNGKHVNRGTDSRRRGIPKHYKDPDGRRRAETLELAGRYRQVGLATAIGAGGGLRVGEVLALRVRHFMTPQQATYWMRSGMRIGGLVKELRQPEVQKPRGIPLPQEAVQRSLVQEQKRIDAAAFRGVLDVSEQASQASKGKIWITGTKGLRKSRIVHLPAFLPNWHGFKRGSTRRQIAELVPRFEDESVPLWDATEEEVILLWYHGFTPLGYLIQQRLIELWHDPSIQHMPEDLRLVNFRELLLFPTRNKARQGRDGQPHVLTDPGWRRSTKIVEGAGTYQGQSNYAQDVNPLYDFVAEQFNSFPEHRTNAADRKGWTHHGLRHWAVSSRIHAGVPFPLIAEEMGHADSAFTLSRYGHVLHESIGAEGFEY